MCACTRQIFQHSQYHFDTRTLAPELENDHNTQHVRLLFLSQQLLLGQTPVLDGADPLVEVAFGFVKHSLHDTLAEVSK